MVKPTLSLSSFSTREGVAVYQQVIDFIEGKINSGELKPGTMLPGSRELAKQLNINRNTLMDAFERLIAKGLLKTEGKKGTFVSGGVSDSPVLNANHLSAGFNFDFNIFEPMAKPVIPAKQAWEVKFDIGYPDPSLAPLQELNTAYKRAFVQNTRLKKAEMMQGNPGHEQAVEQVDKILGYFRAIKVSDENICFIMGIQTALYLIAQTLLAKGDNVIVENPGDVLAWQVLQRAGAKLLPVQVDAGGINTDEIEILCKQKKIKAVYISPQNQYPTTAVLLPERRQKIIDLAIANKFAIIETDFDYEFQYGDHLTLPMIVNNIEGPVIYLSCLSKMMPPLSWVASVAGPAPFMCSLKALWESLDQQGDTALEQAILYLVKEGILMRHNRKSTSVYKARRDATDQFIQKYMKEEVTYEKPETGLAYWLNFKHAVDTSALEDELKKEGILLPSPAQFGFDGKAPGGFRFGFGSLPADKLEAGIKAIASIIKSRPM